MKQLNGTHITIIVVAFLLMLGGLVFSGRDTAALMSVGLLLLAGLGFGGAQIGAQLSQVKENTNGTLSELTGQIRHLTNLLVASQPTPEALALLKPVSAPPVVDSVTTLLPQVYQ